MIIYKCGTIKIQNDRQKRKKLTSKLYCYLESHGQFLVLYWNVNIVSCYATSNAFNLMGFKSMQFDVEIFWLSGYLSHILSNKNKNEYVLD